MLFKKPTLFAWFDRSFAPRSGIRPAGRTAVPAVASSRATAAVTLLVFVLSSWLGAKHDATTVHVRCAQHGEMIDRGVPLAGESRSAAPDPERSVHSAPDGAVGGHVHCSLSTMIHTPRIVANPPVLAAARLAVVASTVAAVHVAITRDRACYRTAPKTSPPA
ncbi:MAG TPA: hypothetical protein VHT91_06080 [Kofleriaceae bacterium]|nr:hypothetical protein [Kofleriaceae bacterium]